MNAWIETYTGRQFYYIKPRPDDVCLEDVAYALSNICRYTGHSSIFYSVAEHSCLCADEAETRGYPDSVALACLLHDSAEAYVGDVNSPLKSLLHGFKDIKRAAHNACAAALMPGIVISPEQRLIVKDIDIQMLRYEATVLMPSKGYTWNWPDNAADIVSVGIMRLTPEQARGYFIAKYEQLLGRCGASTVAQQPDAGRATRI
jgi:hypothetical protein